MQAIINDNKSDILMSTISHSGYFKVKYHARKKKQRIQVGIWKKMLWTCDTYVRAVLATQSGF